MSIGITGAHRVGKTTLAKAVAARLNLSWVQSDVGGVLTELGLDASKPMDFKTRMFAQHKILEWHNELWSKHRSFITDRTPLDFLMYTLADINQNSTDWDADILRHYADACYSSANMYFSSLVLVQPGIAIVEDETKNTGALTRAFIDKLNTLMLGIASDPRLEALFSVIPAAELDLERRIKGVADLYKEDLQDLEESVKQGNLVFH